MYNLYSTVTTLFCLFNFLLFDQLAGDLDSDFGNGGIIISNLNGGYLESNVGVFLQSDGKVITAGVTNFGSSGEMVLQRYLSNGILDNTFGTNGKTSFNPPKVTSTFSLWGKALQTDGKILVSGRSGNLLFLIRFTANGNLDSTFGEEGMVLESFGNLFLQEEMQLQYKMMEK